MNVYKEIIIKIIQNKLKINVEDKVYSLFLIDKIIYLNINNEKDQILTFLENAGSKNLDDKASIIFTEDLAIITS